MTAKKITWKPLTEEQKRIGWVRTYQECLARTPATFAVVASGSDGRCAKHKPRPKKPAKPKATKPRWSVDLGLMGQIQYQSAGGTCTWPSAAELAALLNRIGAKLPKGRAT